MTRTRSVALALALVAAGVGPAVLVAPPASAATSFTFYGGGWGHGVGMSQYGAYGFASEGKDDGYILSYYYPGTSIQDVAAPSTLRVGLLQSKTSIQLRATFGSIILKLTSPTTGKKIATIPSDRTWTIQFRSDGKFWIHQANGKYTGGHGWGGPSTNLYALYLSTHAIAVVPGAHRYNLGNLEFNVYTPCGASCYRGRLVLNVATNSYVYGIAEVPASWPMEALKAQAVAARTYGVYRADTAGQHRAGCNCAVYASVYDQTYIGYDRVAGTDGSRWKAAADATASQVVTYRGNPIAAFYSSSDGGWTESNDHVFGGAALPYLPEKCDPADYNSANPNKTWSTTMSGATIGADIRAYTGKNVGTVTSFSDSTRTGSDRIQTVQVHGTLGTATITGNDLRGALGLKSSLVYINRNLTITGLIRTVYDGDLCAPGHPTNPAVTVAGEGRYQTFDNGDIYSVTGGDTFYFAGGPELAKYHALGGVSSVLGWPLDPPVAITGGTRTDFTTGSIYDGDSTGAWESHGPVWTQYKADGGAQGPLGFPITDVHVSGDTQTQTYQNGTITCVSGVCS